VPGRERAPTRPPVRRGAAGHRGVGLGKRSVVRRLCYLGGGVAGRRRPATPLLPRLRFAQAEVLGGAALCERGSAAAGHVLAAGAGRAVTQIA